MKIEAVPFARKVLEYAEQEHEDYKFDMGTFWNPIYRNPSGVWQEQLVCGTQACLAGTAVFLDSEVSIKLGFPYRGGFELDDEEIEERGRELLGLSGVEKSQLFYVDGNEVALSMLRRWIEEAEARESAAD